MKKSLCLFIHQIKDIYKKNNYDFFVLRTSEIETAMRIPGYRPTCLCLFIHQIREHLCLQAGSMLFCLMELFF